MGSAITTTAPSEQPLVNATACVPFRYDGEIVSGCVGEEGKWAIVEVVGEGGVMRGWTVKGKWCATEVDENQNVASITTCTTVPGEVCVPFRYKDEIVRGCAGEDGKEEIIETEGERGEIYSWKAIGRWCASEVDKNLNIKRIITCPLIPHKPKVPPMGSAITTTGEAVNPFEKPLLIAPSEQPLVNATACVPFRHDGEIVSGCVGEEGVEETIEMEGEGGVINRETVSGRWCASEVDENLNVVKVIACPTMPPVIELPPSVTSSESPGENVNLLCVIMLTLEVLTMYYNELYTLPPAPSEQPLVNATACVPFRYDGEIVSGCVGEEGKWAIIEVVGEGGVMRGWTVKGKWCATEVDENQNIASITTCTTAPGEVCVPFRYKDEIVRGCAGEDGKVEIIETEGERGEIYSWKAIGRWCASEVDKNLNIKRIINCPVIPHKPKVPPMGSAITTTAPSEQPLVNATACVPFRHDGEIVSGCVGEEGMEETIEMEGEGGVINRETVSGRWCASEVDENLNVVKVIACPTMPPVIELPPSVTSSESPAPSEQPLVNATACVPFRYGGEIVSGCVGEEGKWAIIEVVGEGGVMRGWTVKGKWCATEVDENQNVASITTCTTAPGEVCVPFRYKDEIVRGCAGEDGKEEIIETEGERGEIYSWKAIGRWCASEVDKNLNIKRIINCPVIPHKPKVPPMGSAITTTAPRTGQCVPFRYGGEIKSECVGEEGKWEIIKMEREGGVSDIWTVKGKWCAAEVDKDMHILSIIQCPMNQCVPFRYGKEIVSGCVGEEGKVETFELVGEGGGKFKLTLSYRWCVSEVDENLNVMKIIRCPEFAPLPKEPPMGATTTPTALSVQPPVNATECVPFRHNGEIVSGCVGEEGVEETIEIEGEGGVINRETVSGRWCASAVDENLNAVSVIACPTMPPVIELPPSVTSSESPGENVNLLCVIMLTLVVLTMYSPSEQPPVNATACVPFRHDGEIVSGCVGEEGMEETIEMEGEGGVINRETVSGRWCASEVDENLNAVSVIACPTVPPVIELPPSVTSSESPGENVNLLCVIMLTLEVLTMYYQ
ncbi:uncharacterized protein [Penaeus vannamei]|uniref:uncharacterized protein n=1 Tax=Penaeus vannamei TaxID=6689 RepID=UPI00387F7008